MPLNLGNTNYNGEVLENLYVVLGTGNEVVSKGAARVIAGISGKFALPRLSSTADPIGDYVQGSPNAETVTTTYAEREMLPLPGMLYQKFVPTAWLGTIWEKWKSAGDFTNLELNAELMNAILSLHQNGIGEQISKLFWQGDTTLGAGNPLNKFNGIITRAKLDVNVIKPTPAGNITDVNFPDILAAVWTAIPDKFIDDPDFILHINTTDYKTMMAGNAKMKEAFMGVFGQSLETMYQTNKIKHFSGIPRHHIVGARVTNDDSSNLNLAVYVAPEDETLIVDKVAADSREWFMRLDMLADANYRCSEELVLYTPV